MGKVEAPNSIPAGTTRYQLAAARRRLAWVRRLEEAIEAAGGRNIVRLTKEVASAIRRHDPAAAVSSKSLYSWRAVYLRSGFAGLLHPARNRPLAPPQYLDRLCTGELLDLIAEVTAILQGRHRSEGAKP